MFQPVQTVTGKKATTCLRRKTTEWPLKITQRASSPKVLTDCRMPSSTPIGLLPSIVSVIRELSEPSTQVKSTLHDQLLSAMNVSCALLHLISVTILNFAYVYISSHTIHSASNTLSLQIPCTVTPLSVLARFPSSVPLHEMPFPFIRERNRL